MSLSLEREAAVAAFLRHLKRRNLAPTTVRGYEGGLRLFLERLPAERALAAVRRDDVRLHLASRPRESARHELTTLRAFFADLLGDDVALPTDALHSGRPKPKPPVLLAPDAVSALMAVASDESWREPSRVMHAFALRDRAILELLYGAGLRCAEVAATRLVDLELTGGTLLVRRAKRGPSRVVPLPPAAVPHLRRYVRDGRSKIAREGDDDAGALLLSLRGRPLTSAGVYGLVVRLARRADVRAHPHAFRRAVATSLVRGGASVLAVKELLGHADLSTTAAYVSLDLDDLRRAVAHLDRAP